MIEPSSERYVKAGELAELMGVSVRTINRWVTEGMPSEDWGISRTRRYVPSQSIEWAHARSTRDKWSVTTIIGLDGAPTPPGPTSRR